jgi:hypothetical protein
MFWGSIVRWLFVAVLGTIPFQGAVAHDIRARKAEREKWTRCAWNLQTLSHIDTDFYRYKLTRIERDVLSASAKSIDPLELAAVLHLRNFVSFPVILAPDIGKHKSTPGFDGVIYDHYGVAYSNLSIKNIDVSKLTGGRITQTIRSARSSAMKQLHRVYDFESFFDRQGFYLTRDNLVRPRPGLPHQVRAAARMQYFIDLFGLNPESPRKTTVLINVFNSDLRPGSTVPRFELRKWSHRMRRHSETYLFVRNADGSMNDFGANLSHLAENLREDSRVSEFIFLSPTQILIVREGEILLKEINPQAHAS